MGMELYAEKESETYARIGDSLQVVKYGESSAYGYFSKEMICLKEKPQLFNAPRQTQLQESADTGQTPAHRETTSCIENFKMLSVIKIEGLSGLMSDGVVGLAPTAQRTQASVLIDELYWNRIISDRVFSFKLNPLSSEGKTSTLTLGSYTLPVGFSSDDISWNKIENPYFWSVKLHQIQIGNRTIETTSNIMIIDTGSANVVIPYKEFEQFRSFFAKKMLCNLNTQGLYQCLCHDDDY